MLSSRKALEPLMVDKISISIAVLDPSISVDGNRYDYKIVG